MGHYLAAAALLATTCTATAPEALRTLRTYATARTYPFSAPISAPRPRKHQVKRAWFRNPATVS